MLTEARLHSQAIFVVQLNAIFVTGDEVVTSKSCVNQGRFKCDFRQFISKV